MATFRKICLITFGWLVFFLPVNTAAQVSEPFGFYLRGNRSFAKIPFEMHSNLIIVPIHINNSDTLRFILDTGVSSIIVTDPKILSNQKLNFSRRVKISGAGEREDPLTASVAISNTLKMGYMSASYQNIVVLDQDVLKLSEFVGMPIHGIFGYELFNNFVVTIDFRSREIILRPPHTYKYRKSKGDKYPISIEETKPYLHMTAAVDNGHELPLKVLIDTGAGHALMLDQWVEPPIQLPEKLIRAQLGRGLNGVINGSIGRIEKIKLGRHEMQNVLASFPDSLSFGIKISNERQGNIGCELLRRFVVTFNYTEGYMVLKPVKKTLREKFEHDMSGLEIRAKGDDLRKYIIERIAAGSPAWAAGLQEGDEIIYLNNALAHNMNISEIYKYLQRGEGKEVTMLVKRGEAVHFTRFSLKRMI
jgi:PDZ domain/Aspartyl protease